MAADDYRISVDQVDAAQWSEALGRFRDANLYQTWAYGEVRWGKRRLSHVILEQRGEIVAAAQTAVFSASPLRAGIAHLRWGPMLQSARSADHGSYAEVAGIMAHTLHAEYVRKRGLYLRVMAPGRADSGDAALLRSAFAEYSAEPYGEAETSRTMLVDLRHSLESIRQRLEQKWRNQLNRAERNALTILEPAPSDAFVLFGSLYGQMVERKGFSPPNLHQFERIQQRLPEHQRMKILICFEEDAPVAGIVASAIGNTGIYLLGATNEQGMKCKGAYLLQWRMMLWLKQQGVEFYDLGGINPETNPGVYHFKRGIGGDDIRYIVPLVACASAGSRVVANVLKLARRRERLMRVASRAKHSVLSDAA
jgi:hypothetical protein